MSNVQPIKAIYYPHVEFGSAAWVKSILLYWEGVYRPLPEGAQPHDEPEIRRLFEEGLIEDLPLEPFTSRAQELLGRLLEELLGGRNGRLPESIPEICVIRGLAPAYIDRKREEVVQFFQSQGWMRAAKAVRAMHAQTLALYSTVLNYLIAQERNLAPVTDDPVFDAMSTLLEVGNVADERRKVVPVDALAAAQIFVPMLSVDVAAQLSVEKLVEIRRKLAADRRSFRERVQTQAAAIAALPDVDAVREHLAALASDLGEQCGAAREALKEAKVQDRWTLMGVSAPASLAVGMALAGGALSIAGPAGQVSLVALGVSEWFLDHRKALRQPGNHYIVSLESAVKDAERRGPGAALRALRSH